MFQEGDVIMEIKQAAFQTPITIKEVIDAIHRKRYFLPAIQREFVWDADQIMKLFDSLMRGYTIGSFLFWNVDKDRIKNFQFYEFIREYHEKYNVHNPKANVTGEEELTVILDGQQRLTALYIALKGTYAYKIARKRWESDDAFPKRKLYLNLLSKSDEFDLLYDFSFLTNEKAIKRNSNNFWFEVAKIIEFESLRDINKFLRDNELMDSTFAEECLFNLYEVITEKKVINYYLETSQELDKVLNIFIRVNSGGTQLSYSDLLLSIATAQWKTKDAREEITSFVEEINRIGDGFIFNKDFILKSCLVLSDLPEIAFKVDNFSSTNMSKIERSWYDIAKSIRIAIELLSDFGYNYQTLTSANAIIPIAYYILTKGNPENFILASLHREDRDRIRRWFGISVLKRAFSGQPDNVLRPIRSIIQESNNKFPLEKIIERFKGTNKSLVFTNDDVENFLYSKYGKSHTFSVLAFLYPTFDFRNKFHQDHIFPKSFFKKAKLKKKDIASNRQGFYLENCNYIGNLQLLEGLLNEEKSNADFTKWLEKSFKTKAEKTDYMRRHYIPQDISLDFDNFEEFFNKREELIAEKLREMLDVKIADLPQKSIQENGDMKEAERELSLSLKTNRPRQNVSNRVKKGRGSGGASIILELLKSSPEPLDMSEIVRHMKTQGYKSKTYYEWANALVDSGLAVATIKRGRRAYMFKQERIARDR